MQRPLCDPHSPTLPSDEANQSWELDGGPRRDISPACCYSVRAGCSVGAEISVGSQCASCGASLRKGRVGGTQARISCRVVLQSLPIHSRANRQVEAQKSGEKDTVDFTVLMLFHEERT